MKKEHILGEKLENTMMISLIVHDAGVATAAVVDLIVQTRISPYSSYRRIPSFAPLIFFGKSVFVLNYIDTLLCGVFITSFWPVRDKVLKFRH